MTSPKLHIAHALIALGALGVFLPWFRDSSGTTAGIGEPDGRATLIALTVAAVAVAAGSKLSWLPAAFAAVIAGRDVDRIADSASASVSWGIWVSTVCAALAAVILIADLVRSARVQQPGGVTPRRE